MMCSYLLDDLSYLNKSEKEPDYVYIGFWRRVFALFVDSIFLSVIFFTLAFSINYYHFGNVIIFIYLYFPLMESSKFQATLGKKIVGAKVINKKGKRIGFLHALARFLLKFISYIVFFIGFIMIAFNKEKQGLHDIIASTYVVENRD